MPDFDEAAVEEEHVGRVERDAFGFALPFDRFQRATGVPVTIHVETELYIG